MPQNKPNYLYKLITEQQWSEMKAHGIKAEFGSELDQKDGFLHFSSAKQIERIAKKYFPNLEDGKLVQFDLSKIEDLIQWEPNSAGDLYPHAYGLIPMDGVEAVHDFNTQSFDFSNLPY